MKQEKKSLSVRVYKNYIEIIDMISKKERRPFSYQMNIILEDWILANEEKYPEIREILDEE